MSSVTAALESLTIPTYPVGEPEKNPVFFDKRVYQGSSGKVYPVPFIDKVYDEPIDKTYQSARLENDFIRLVMLPEIGGRIFLGQDKTNQDYDFFYRQDVIKPALVGLAGPWISGGVEFNWPQHHRPSTFMPTDVHIENEADGAATIWMSEHDPLNRLKGMHGIRIRPGSSLIELRARLYNRTPLTQTFLWWANVAALVHDQYQSFFPPDVNYVADHAVRALSSFPVANNPYYGVDYQNRPGANDLSWYRNIPVPTSYMVCQTLADFFGGYDFKADGGFVHVANRHIAPGKKQWTWGDHEFGHAWDRELTDTNGPYVELMAGVYTDNQPDFTYLLPYETKTFSQFWWPIQGIGPAHAANQKAAVSLNIGDDRKIALGLNVSESFEGELVLTRLDAEVARFDITLQPGEVWKNDQHQFEGEQAHELYLSLRDREGQLVIDYRPVDESTLTRDRAQATEPPQADEISSADELFFTGEHLELYRHPTRKPEPYYERCLAIDPDDARANLALGKRLLRKGLFTEAHGHLEKAIGRLTFRHPNPVTGEAHYYQGLVLRQLGDPTGAYSHFYKATWNSEWRASAFYQLATLDCLKGDFDTALTHLDESLATNRDNNKSKNLIALLTFKKGKTEEARKVLTDLRDIDPLDHWSAHLLHLMGAQPEEFLTATRNDAQTILDLAFDYCEAGFTEEALGLIELHHEKAKQECAVPNPLATSQMTQYLKAWLTRDPADLVAAQGQASKHFFPSRAEERTILEWAQNQPGGDPLASYGLGNTYYDLGRHTDALAAWKLAAQADNPQAHRNLGLALWNVRQEREEARESYLRAIALDPQDARLVLEFDQLCQRLNEPLEERLAFLEERRELVLTRDDVTVALASLYNLLNRPQEALDLVMTRPFHPWEGGEGQVLRQYTTARLLLGQEALEKGQAKEALRQFQLATETPDSLGEKYHLLQAKADINYWLGRAYQALEESAKAKKHFELSAAEVGDFSEMAVTAHSPLSYFRGLSLQQLGRTEEARQLFQALAQFAQEGLATEAKIDYFATSLPNLLVFEENLQERRDAENNLLLALAHHGLQEEELAAKALEKTLAFTLCEQRAADLQREMLEPVTR
ncbi:DUF5107 domain-containing protein [Roseibacillus persicicus]|uniref:DUF5107 domain-containing protein n=1 Tax=Roseibacillus persicicus TaxID=454148 RepID=UPI00280CB6DA|nr:DUF5107 domain-containing protein [Roseibacillus persicicus]MDQ8191565.1 DUF5107 domain-containing protein [Roseibacillus persicicus]